MSKLFLTNIVPGNVEGLQARYHANIRQAEQVS